MHGLFITVVAAGFMISAAVADPDPKSDLKIRPPVAAPAGAHSLPPIFSDKSYADALDATRSNGKLLIVKATAVWCGPCKAMNRTTFVDPAVVKWVGDNGMAIEFDVDKDTKLAEALNIRAMPTTLLYREGKEIGRVVGYKNGTGLISWLEDAKAGKAPGEDLAIKVEKAKEGGEKVGMQERMNIARNLVMNEKYESATLEYVWLWNNIVKEELSMFCVRGSFLAGDIGRLIEQHKPARIAFTEIRDQVEARLQGENKTFEDLNDWIVLNEQLQQTDKTLAWFDRVKGQEGGVATIERVGFRIERLLETSGRLGDLGRLEKNPLMKLKGHHALVAMVPQGVDKAMQQIVQEAHQDLFRQKATVLYTSLLLAGREADAEQVGAEAIKLDDSPTMKVSLVKMAANNRVARPVHLDWLKLAHKEPGVAELQTEVERQVGRVN